MAAFPRITAHTGCEHTPDNSIASVEAGLGLQADIIEDDIRVTRNGVLVLHHDDEVRLSDGTSGRISSMRLEELRSAFPAPLAELETALGMVDDAGKLMNLDLKADACIEPVSELVRRLDMRDQVFLTGCDYNRSRLVKLQAPHLRRLLNVNVSRYMHMDFEEAARLDCEEALDAGCFGLNVPYRLVQPALLELAADRRLPVYVWTVDEEALMEQYAGMGVHSITTRRVAALQALRRDWQKESGPA
ncbi:glycerophosphodiester phosphodiesterase [Cohnella sp. JJ-181]|uniref:glycerophosphodiester phosphodiesterase n=1 Tax=Cohnella rhizoplanae TaxID=2974897 RepID=UPI0022FF8461|nr:glycerophosphodiester phosphodiesterase [Cohnella sp. JJ-181]CAI6085755.1 hypothetical protein COHCIP112018_04781 [Cohnella sp. JJ-181]